MLVKFLVKPSFAERFRDLISATAKASLEHEMGCRRFDVLFDPKGPRRFVLHEIRDDEEALFDEHLASAHYRSFAAAIENEIEQPSARRLAFNDERAENVRSVG